MIRGLALIYIAVTVCILPAARAQQPDRVARVGVLVPSIGPSDSLVEALRRGLRDLGYVEGKNIRYEFRSAQGRFDRLPALAEELSRLKVDVIVAERIQQFRLRYELHIRSQSSWWDT